MRFCRDILKLSTGEGISVHDITPRLRDLVAGTGLRDGLLTVTSRHTTTALVINEHETRLLDDIRAFLAQLVPSDGVYLHNDIHLRDCDPNEPRNAHSHLAAMLLGSSESIPLIDGELALGRWQSVLLIELDGCRDREVTVQLMGQ